MGSPRRVVLAVLVAALVAGGCSGEEGGGSAAEGTAAPGSTSASGPSTTLVAESPELVEQPCWWELDDLAELPGQVTVTCGTVEAPVDRTDPATEMLSLAVVRLSPVDADPELAPLLYLHGGPGGDALGPAPVGLARLAVSGGRDVITFDQRGSGRSTPSLNCPEKEEAILDALAAAGTWEDELAANREAVRACHQRLTEDGVDLSAHSTPASVADIETLRAALEVETWDLWGISYGTRLGLAYAREHPDQVRSLLIDSVYPPEVGGVERARSLPQDALDRLVDACAAEDGCSTAIGDLGELLDEAVADLDADPETLTQTIEWGGETVERDFTLTGTDMRAGMFAALYDSELIPLLPSVISGLANGDRDIVPTYIEIGVPRLIDLSEGAFYSVECADSGRSLAGPEAEAALAEVSDDALIALNSAQVFCQDWPVEHVEESFATPALPDVPTLVFGGTLDPITPFADSEAQAEAMPDARLVAVPHGGHGVGAFDDCTRSARDGFWADPSSALPACVAEIEAIPFVVAG